MRNVVLIASAVVLTGSAAVAGLGREDDLARAVAEVERLDAMRAGLAGSIGAAANPDRGMFQAVCAPVGEEGKRLGEANGWTVRQLAEKYRNPVNVADREAAQYLRQLAADPGLQGMWIRTTMNGTPGMRYLRRIDVKESCMPCHGLRDSRPDFIKDGYPRDRAYNFKVGDIRGVYSVFIPDVP
jgi:hypothetical protein